MIEVQFDVITCSHIPVNVWHVLGALIGSEFIFMNIYEVANVFRTCGLCTQCALLYGV